MKEREGESASWVGVQGHREDNRKTPSDTVSWQVTGGYHYRHPSIHPCQSVSQSVSRLSVVCIFHMPSCDSVCVCMCDCRVFAFLNVLENDLLKISLARHRGKTTSKLIKNLLPSLKNVTPVARRSIRPWGKVRTLRWDGSGSSRRRRRRRTGRRRWRSKSAGGI